MVESEEKKSEKEFKINKKYHFLNISDTTTYTSQFSSLVRFILPPHFLAKRSSLLNADLSWQIHLLFLLSEVQNILSRSLSHSWLLTSSKNTVSFILLAMNLTTPTLKGGE